MSYRIDDRCYREDVNVTETRGIVNSCVLPFLIRQRPAGLRQQIFFLGEEG